MSGRLDVALKMLDPVLAPDWSLPSNISIRLICKYASSQPVDLQKRCYTLYASRRDREALFPHPVFICARLRKISMTNVEFQTSSCLSC